MLTLAALYKHRCIADSVKQFITASVPADASLGMPEDMVELSQVYSSFMRLSVWYALLYVVIEEVNSAFKVFFERELPIIETLERLPGNT